MRRVTLRYPLIMALILLACLTEKGTAAASDSENTANLTAGVCLAIPTLVIVWLGVRFSRWLHRRLRWDTFPYLVANTVVAIAIIAISISLSVAMVDSHTGETSSQDTVAILLFLGGLMGGIAWFVRSVWKLATDRSKFVGIHWRLIAPRAPGTRFFQDMPVGQLVQSTSGKTQMLAKKPQRRDKSPSSIFRPVAISDTRPQEVRGVPIPKRITPPQTQKTGSQRTSGSTRQQTAPTSRVSVSYSSPRSSFVAQARKYVSRKEPQAAPVPFMQYWPTYDAMSAAQQRWYFYWRSQLRQGYALPTDLSYLFVYVYEVLNGIGFASTESAFKRLISFWKHYRVLQPKLDNYLVDWLADFVVVYKLPTTPLKWYGVALEEGAFSGDIDLSIEAWLTRSADFHRLPDNLLYKLAGYAPTRSKFFQAHGDEYQLEEAYKIGLQAVEQAQRDQGTSLFKSYRPARARVIQREPFAGALHDLPPQTITLGEVHPWMGSEDLSAALTSIIKYTENIKRVQANFGSQLRGINLPKEWEVVLDKTFAIPEPRREITIDMGKVAQLQQESGEIRERLLVDDKPISPIEQKATDKPTVSATAEPAQRKITIDMDKVTRLQRESEDVRARLLTDEQSLSSGNETPESLSPDHTGDRAGSGTQPGYTQRPADASAGLLTDLPQVAEVMGKAGQTASRLLRFLKDHEWEAAPGDIPREVFEGSFLNVAVDAINEKARQVLNDALIFEEEGRLIVADDFRDEVEFILNHPDYAETTRPASSESYSELTEDWAAFAQKLQPHHWEALAALIGGVEVEVRLTAIARSAYTTSHQLVDEINEFALDSIGDIVVDTEPDLPQIEEEDVEGIHALLEWASQKVLSEG